VKITTIMRSDRRWSLRSMAMMIDDRCVVDHWLVVLNNVVLVHWLVVLDNGVLVHWLVVLSRCRNNRGMSIKWLVRDRHMICDTLRLLSSITITRKGNDISRSHVTTYMNFPHAGNNSNFLNSHRMMHWVHITATYNASQ